MKLQNITDNIYAINLLSRTDRADHLKNEMRKFRFNATISVATDATKISNPTNLRNGEYALIDSYIKVIEWAKSQDLEDILVLEDDATFVDDLEERLEVFNTIPEDWDFIMLGSNQYFLGAGWLPPQEVAPNVLKCYSAYCAHAILWKHKMYDPILNLLYKRNQPIDVAFSELQRSYNAYAIYPSICYQYDSESSIIGINPGYNAKGVFTNNY